MASRVSGDSTDISLLKRVQGGDAMAWRRFEQLYRPLISYWCRRAGYRGADGEDILQEVFLAVHRSIQSFRKDRLRGTFRGWLFTMTRNKIRDVYDARKRRAEVPLPGELPWPEHWAAWQAEEASPQAASQLLLVRRILDLIHGEFPEKSWQAFWLTAVEGLDAPTAAERLGVKPGTVRQAKARVLHRLHQEFGEFL